MSLIARNLSDQLVEVVRDRILSGVVSCDHAIRQDALAAELGVSKIPLREALARLEEEGLVRSQANRGFFVRSLCAAEAQEVYALRIKLEPGATALAATRATEADHAHAIETLDLLDRVTEAHSESVGACNRAFHRALFRPCHQPVTVSILERLQILSERYVRVHLEPLGRDVRANGEHRALLQAWIVRDVDLVDELVNAHLGKTLDDLRQQLAGD
jgi:DNA-binding GntR family transcriptional regulator